MALTGVPCSLDLEQKMKSKHTCRALTIFKIEGEVTSLSVFQRAHMEKWKTTERSDETSGSSQVFNQIFVSWRC